MKKVESFYWTVSVHGVGFTCILPSRQRRGNVRMSSRRIWPWRRSELCWIWNAPDLSTMPLQLKCSSFETRMCQCLFILLCYPCLFPPARLQHLHSQSSSRFSPQSRSDLSDRLGSAAYISCQFWGVCVFPDQSETCLSSWSALNMFVSAGKSIGWFCLTVSLLPVRDFGGRKRCFSKSQKGQIKGHEKELKKYQANEIIKLPASCTLSLHIHTLHRPIVNDSNDMFSL